MSTAPPPPLYFYGRDEYILTLIQLIERGHYRAVASHIIIHGPGGIGKTSIATTLLHHSDVKALFHEHIHFASCEAANSESVLIEVLASSLNLSPGLKDALTGIIQSIREASRPILLILDNFETCWFSDRRYEIHQVLKHLATLNNLTLLVTMRGNEEPPDIRWERLPELGVLSIDDARKLFIDI